jgi:polyisoprenyl-teichoic acid--peptidoglycan teichoic acid transferase
MSRHVVRAITFAIVLPLAAASCTSSTPPPSNERTEPTTAPIAPSVAPPAPVHQLAVTVRGVDANGVEGRVQRSDLAAPTRAIRRTIAELYEIGFVDPVRWEEGEFPSLFRLFAGGVRDQASRDIADLTLGPLARELDAVQPRRAFLDLRFLADGQARPIFAVADVRFAGVAQAGEVRAPVTHEGEYVMRRVNGEWRVVSYDVRGHVPNVLESGPKEAAFLPGLPSNEPMFVLVIGSDARPGQSVTGTRADSIHIVGVNPRHGRVSILGIPRDSWVYVPGYGSDKINSALVRGGPDLLVQAVERLSGIRIDAYLLTGFQGFERMVSAVGGIDIKIPYPIHDRFAGAHFRRGPEHLSGREALAFSRVRKDLPNGDFGRSFNQGRLMIAALATLRRAVADGSAAVVPWAIAAARNLVTDLSLAEMFELLVAAPAFEPRRVRNAVVSGGVGMIAGKSVVVLGSRAHAMFRDLARDAMLGG